jgi:hypothetical protein
MDVPGFPRASLVVFPATTGAGVVFFALKVALHGITGDLTTSPVLEELQVSTDAIVFNLISANFVFHKLEVSPDLVFQCPQASGAFFDLQIPVHLGEFHPQYYFAFSSRKSKIGNGGAGSVRFGLS